MKFQPAQPVQISEPGGNLHPMTSYAEAIKTISGWPDNRIFLAQLWIQGGVMPSYDGSRTFEGPALLQLLGRE